MRKENKMKISFDLTEQEYMEHISFCMRNSEIFRKKIEKMRLMLSTTPALLGITIVSVTGSKGFNFFIGIIFLTAAVFVISPMLFHKLIENKVLKIIYKKDSNILDERTILFKHSYLNEKTSQGDNIVEYSQIFKAKQTDKAIYLFNSPVSTIIIPFRVFSSEEEKEEFINFIKSKLSFD